MPIFRSGEGNAPSWCELENFELINLTPDAPKTVERKTEKEVFLVCQGRINLVSGNIDCNSMPGGWVNLHDNSEEPVELNALYTDALVFRAMGRWDSITGAGLFDVWTTTPPDFDTPYDYDKTTRFDNHYHDFDEYWVVFEGEATVATEGKLFDVGPGDCIATGMGWHHDVVSVKDDRKMWAVYFESGREGKGRTGHLWEPKHGKAEPQLDRV